MNASHAALKNFPNFLPVMEFRADQFYCADTCIDVADKPLTRGLFLAFLRHRHQPMSRAALVKHVYRDCFAQAQSDRFMFSLSQNLIKLISRARILADEATNKDERWIDWFPYEPISQTWSLYRLTNDYIARCQSMALD